MNCNNFKVKIVKYADGELLPDEAIDFEVHLKHCPSCRQEVEMFKNLNQLIDSAYVEIPTLEISPIDITREVIRKIQPGNSKRLFHLLRDMLAAAAAAMIIFWYSGTLVNNVEIPPYSQEVVEVSNTVGGIFRSYMMVPGDISEKFSKSINNITPGKRKGR